MVSFSFIFGGGNFTFFSGHFHNTRILGVLQEGRIVRRLLQCSCDDFWVVAVSALFIMGRRIRRMFATGQELVDIKQSTN